MKISESITKTARLGITSACAVVALGVGSAQADGVVAAATGGYQTTYFRAERSIEFNAKRNSENETWGQGQFFNRDSGTMFHFSIDCLHVDGNVATMTGTGASDANPDFPYVWLRVVDNGEGSESTDFHSAFVNFDGPISCTDDSGFEAVFAVEGGNIQVRAK